MAVECALYQEIGLVADQACIDAHGLLRGFDFRRGEKRLHVLFDGRTHQFDDGGHIVGRGYPMGEDRQFPESSFRHVDCAKDIEEVADNKL